MTVVVPFRGETRGGSLGFQDPLRLNLEKGIQEKIARKKVLEGERSIYPNMEQSQNTNKAIRLVIM